MKPTPTMRNYLVTIHELSQQNCGQSVSTGSLASTLKVTPGTVTSMMKQLSGAGLLTYKPYRGVEITSEGKRLASRITKRRDALARFLIKTLEITQAQAKTEAVKLESFASDRLILHIEKLAN